MTKRSKDKPTGVENIEMMRAIVTAYDRSCEADDDEGRNELVAAASRIKPEPLAIVLRARGEREWVPESIELMSRYFSGDFSRYPEELLRQHAVSALFRLAEYFGVEPYAQAARSGGATWEATANKLLEPATFETAHARSGRRGQPRGGGPRNRAAVLAAMVMGCSAEHIEDVLKRAGARKKYYDGPDPEKQARANEDARLARQRKQTQRRYDGVIMGELRARGELIAVDPSTLIERGK